MPYKAAQFLVAICMLCATRAMAQKPAKAGTDAVLRKIGLMKEDSNKVNAYFLPGNVAAYDDRRIPAIYVTAGDLAKKINFRNGMLLADESLAAWYNDKTDYIKALQYARLALEEAKQISPQKVIEVLLFTRWIYRGPKNIEKAIWYDKQALAIAQKTGDNRLICGVYVSLVNDYGDQNKFDTSLVYANKALLIAEKLNSPELKGIVYSELSWVYSSSKKYLAAYRYTIKAAQTEDPHSVIAANTLSTLGEIYRDAPDSSLVKMGIRPGQRAQKVLECFTKALAIAKSNHVMESMADNYSNVSKSYAGMGNYKQAYSAYQNYILYRDSTANQTQQKMIIQNEAREREQALKYQQQIEAVKARQLRNYYIGGIAVLLLISFFIARNYFTQRKLNKLISIEKQRSDDLLNNILPADVAEELKQTGEAKARHFEEVTVLFTDFVKFTTVSELLTPQELVDELNECFKAFDHIMMAHRIEKIKTIGDAYLAVAGLPNADASHSANIIRAAMEIRSFIANRKAKLGPKSFDIRIGVHSGNVVAGIVGVKKFAYDIWGDTVNTAARMEQNSEAGKINISEKTKDLLKNEFKLTYRGEIDAKNKGLMKMYFVEG